MPENRNLDQSQQYILEMKEKKLLVVEERYIEFRRGRRQILARKIKIDDKFYWINEDLIQVIFKIVK